MRILVTAASKHGSTIEIAQAIADELTHNGLSAELKLLEDVRDISAYQAVVLGSAVYAGHWQRSARVFAHGHAKELRALPTWLFSSGPLGDPLRPNDAVSVNIDTIAKEIRPKEHRIFAGKLDSHQLRLGEKFVTRITHAPKGDFRNWKDIQAWSKGIAESLAQKR